MCLLVACNRTPDEPSSHVQPDPLPTVAAATTTDQTTTHTPLARCVTHLASVAPAIPPPANDRCPPDKLGRLKLARAPIAFTEASVSVDAELARTDDESERGLMFRKIMGENEGMFFFLDSRKIQTFWMHNTCIPLDMIFVDEDGTIVGVVESAPVLDDGQRAVDCPSRYVLEVNAGWVRRHGVLPGQHLIVPR